MTRSKVRKKLTQRGGACPSDGKPWRSIAVNQASAARFERAMLGAMQSHKHDAPHLVDADGVLKALAEAKRAALRRLGA